LLSFSGEEALLFGVVALDAFPEAGEAVVFFVGVCAFASVGKAALVLTGVGAFAFAGEAAFFATGVWAFAFAGEAFLGEVFFVTRPACTFSATAVASWALVESVGLRGELLVTLRSGLSDLTTALVFLAGEGVAAFLLPVALAGVPSARDFAMVVRCDVDVMDDG
jgi:hypothetical protein